MAILGVFSGRVIFDHLPKTAGQAINSWLRASLGGGCVTPQMHSSHGALIKRYGGEFSVLQAHTEFSGEGLDPRYQYVTCLREPIDRAISWLYYVLKNHNESYAKPGLWEAVQAFLDKDGACSEEKGDLKSLLSDSHRHHICNPYVEHFAAICPDRGLSDTDKLDIAISLIQEYDVWGFYESMPDFLADFSALLGIPAPSSIARVNTTRERPAASDISAKLRKRLEELNALDIEFYRVLQARYADARKRFQRSAVTVPQWRPFERPGPKVFSGPEFSLLSATLEGSGNRMAGSLLSFSLEFSLPREVDELEIGIHILDEDGSWAFGTNSTLLGQPLTNVAAGTHRLTYAIAANLPEGEYTAGFAFAERTAEGLCELAWYDKLLGFRINLLRASPSVGYVNLPTAIDCQLIAGRIVRPVLDARGALLCGAVMGDLVVGEALFLPIVLSNGSGQDWTSLMVHPINVSYVWLDEQGGTVVAEGARTPLPGGSLRAGDNVDVVLSIEAPNRPGRYRLRILPVQEYVCWFDELGFIPFETEVAVVAADSIRRFPARDVRFCSQIGHVDAESLISSGQTGFLLHGAYSKIQAGNWRAVLSGFFEVRGGSIRLDVAAGGGAQVIASSDADGSSESLYLEFRLDESLNDLEVRVWVDGDVNVRIDHLTIEPLESGSASVLSEDSEVAFSLPEVVGQAKVDASARQRKAVSTRRKRKK